MVDSSQIVEELVAREEEFYAAQTASDVDKLDEILSDEMTRFVHTTGKVDDKASYLEAVRSGRYVHGPIIRLSGMVRATDEGAVTIGVVDMVSRPPGQSEFAMRLQQVLFWVKDRGSWRLLVRQAVREPL